MANEEKETQIMRELRMRSVLDYLVPVLLTALIGLVSFFGANWINRVERDTLVNRNEIRIVSDKQLQADKNIESLTNSQSLMSNNLIQLSSRFDTQSTDVSNRLVKIETKLDFLLEREKKNQ